MMPFLIKGKTNWKFILIVLVLAILVGGGILGYFEHFKKEIVFLTKFPEIKKPEKVVEEEPKKIVGEEKVEVKIYFSNPEMYNELQKELCPGETCPREMYERYGTDECGYFFSVIRKIPKPKNETELVQLLIGELLKGPTEEEQDHGFRPNSPFIKMIKDFEIKNTTLTIRLDEKKIAEWEKGITPRSFYSLTSCEWIAYIGSLMLTLSENLKISIEIIPSPI